MYQCVISPRFAMALLLFGPKTKHYISLEIPLWRFRYKTFLKYLDDDCALNTVDLGEPDLG